MNDEAFQGKGMGGLLLKYCIEANGSIDVHLDVIASDENAAHLNKNVNL